MEYIIFSQKYLKTRLTNNFNETQPRRQAQEETNYKLYFDWLNKEYTKQFYFLYFDYEKGRTYQNQRDKSIDEK